MQLTNYPTSPSGDTIISFPKLESWNILTEVATIAAQVNKKRVLCRISLEILQEKFGDSEEPMRSVALHRRAIQEAARKLIESELYEEDGSVLIRSRDL
ncbi:MAG: DUF1488 domain-containing protein [Gammaproteobacteria bacterium]